MVYFQEYLFAGSGIYLSTASFFVSDRIKESERRLSISCCILLKNVFFVVELFAEAESPCTLFLKSYVNRIKYCRNLLRALALVPRLFDK